MQDDLKRFHSQHFHDAPLPYKFFCSEEEIQELNALYEDEEGYDEDEDGLGYYLDGTKRALTDEQIALFRHSEIQALLRERRLREEQEDTPPVDQDVGASSGLKRKMAEDVTVASMPPPKKKKKKKNRKKRPAKASELSQNGPQQLEQQEEREHQDLIEDAAGNEEAEHDEDKEDFTPRRIERERDIVAAEHLELDYG